jgi:hypothetical protein
MKQSTGVAAALTAITSSMATLGCCLPLGYAGALGTAGASAIFGALQPWLLGLSLVLLCVGFRQQRRARQCALGGRWLGEAMLWGAVATFLGMVLFRQQIAGFLADWRPK